MLFCDAPSVFRFRVRVARKGPAAGLSHLGQIAALRAAVAESGLPFVPDGRRKQPRPRMAFGPAVALGYESEAEYFDMELTRSAEPAEIMRSLKFVGAGFEVREARRIPPYFPSLESVINVARYELRGPFPEDAACRLRALLERPEIVVEKVKDNGARVERIDAKPLILSAVLSASDCLDLVLRFGPGKTLKPEALLREWLGPQAPVTDIRILRKELWSQTADGELIAP
ncbi:MAG: TIGR03936 family radical SAM-associated protein [Elusimicrobiota bacterium]|jgi:radical SAM-linked protein